MGADAYMPLSGPSQHDTCTLPAMAGQQHARSENRSQLCTRRICFSRAGDEAGRTHTKLLMGRHVRYLQSLERRLAGAPIEAFTPVLWSGRSLRDKLHVWCLVPKTSTSSLQGNKAAKLRKVVTVGNMILRTSLGLVRPGT